MRKKIMSETIRTNDDEIDWFELFKILWHGKWLISAFVVISVLCGFLYSQLVQPKFEVSMSFQVNLFSSSDIKLCNNSIGCLQNRYVGKLKAYLNRDWNVKSNKLILVLNNEKLKSTKIYHKMFDNLNQKITNNIYNEALDDIAHIKTFINDNSITSDYIFNRLFLAERQINEIDNGQKAISFNSLAIKKISRKVHFILTFSILLGGIIGVVFVLVNNAIRKWKESESKV